MFSGVFVCVVLNLYYSVSALIFAQCSKFDNKKKIPKFENLPVNFVEDNWKVLEIYSLLCVLFLLMVAFILVFRFNSRITFYVKVRTI